MENPLISIGEYILGIDLGTSSVGWAMIGWRDGGPVGLVRAGSRIFDAGVDVDNKSGKESSRNLARRTARIIRRQHWRRARRLKKIFNLLQSFGLLPEGRVSSPEERQEYLNRLDQSILTSSYFQEKSRNAAVGEPKQVMPFLLRAAALDEPMEPFHLGRAFYHLAQRRGFLSNRKEAPSTSTDKEEEEEGKVKAAITELQKSVEGSGARTLGEYFARLNPHGTRIRRRWTSRAMYEHEFAAMWDSQVRFHPVMLTAEHRKALRAAIFFQRPLKTQKNLIGKCELDPGERRASRYLLLAQRFRMLQRVNDLLVQSTDGSRRRLTADERHKLLESLELEGDQTFAAIRKLLGVGKSKFNLEEGGETKLPGNRTASQLYAVFGARWIALTPVEKDQVVEYAHSFQRADKFEKAAIKKFALDEASAAKFASVRLEQEYFGLSRRAMEKLLPSLEEGVSYADAQFNAYGEKNKHRLCDLLPPVERWEEIRNPGVTRSLSELRKVVNAIVRQYGKPMEIRIELARDLRQTKSQREKAWRKNRENQRSREKAAKRILDEVGLAQPSNDDIRRVLLAEECQFTCPYTGRAIPMAALIGRESQFDIEHIIPFSRSLDNSFANLTLCYHEENRNIKRNQTPGEAYASSPDRFKEILSRVGKFRPDFRSEKLRRFRMSTSEVEKAMEDFTSRQLNDTRYATRLAGEYLALLYGGRVDEGGTLRIRATAGQVTAFLRGEWKLNTILRDGPSANGGATPKSREDHRHHAVDAVVTALTDDGTIQALSRAAERAAAEKRKRFAMMEGPWPNFVDTVREEVERIIVSHRPQKKVSGALHEETFYSAPKGSAAGGVRRVRKLLSALSQNEVHEIVDARVREIVLSKLRQVGSDDPKTAFGDPKNLPFLTASNGRKIPIKSVRVFKKLPTFPLGSGRGTRFVASESNHHIEIFAELDGGGTEVVWDGHVIALNEAYKRKKAKMDVVNRNSGSQRQFKFSLSPGEIVECDTVSAQRGYFVVRKMSQLSTGRIQLGFAPIRDARQAKIMQASRAWLWAGPESLRTRNARKVSIGPLGDVSEAHD